MARSVDQSDGRQAALRAAEDMAGHMAPAPFEITRVFQASCDRVWRAWAVRDQLQRWWGPKGCTVKVARFEFRPGGFFHYAMKCPAAPVMWGRFNYRDIIEGKRIVWLNSFANENCGIARAPFDELCPLEIENQVTFTPQADSTIVTLRARPFGEVAAERAYFDALRPSLDEGYGGTFDKLEDLVRA